MKVICVNCNKKMSHDRSGEEVLETFEDGKKPYKVWCADLYSCTCGNKILTGFPQVPLRHDFDQNFQTYVDQCKYKFK